MQLVFIHGAPAVGKLTVAGELAALTGFRLFHNHLTVDLVGSVFTFGSEPFVRLREEIWLATFREAVRHRVSLIFTFNPESTVHERFIQDSIDVVTREGGELVFVELTCDEGELETRIENPSRGEFDKLRSVEQYRSLREAGAFQYPRIVSDLSLDTTNSSPVDVAHRIRKHLADLGSPQS
ncbi:MAG: AAA family ATPase [Acidobacteriota bacterium]|nr:AAA family ATPase [Acidobacteriota bacterium]